MQDKEDFTPTRPAAPLATSELRALSEAEFAALGADRIVFHRAITAHDLAAILPQAKLAPQDAVFEVVLAADGQPVLVTDNVLAVNDWLSEHDIELVSLH